MGMAPRLRKFMLTAHVVSSVGALGAVTAFLALAITGLIEADPRVSGPAYIAMDVIASLVVVPLVFASLATGVVQSLNTAWGLFRHYWVLVKFILTIFVAVVLLLQMDLINYVAGVEKDISPSGADLRVPRISLALHAIGGLLVLLVTAALSVYKPRGMTRYGWQRQHEDRAA
jgi:uncharacterized membrane protein